MNGNGVRALAVSNSGNPYAGGWFTTAGGMRANYVARWSSSTTTTVASSSNPSTYGQPVTFTVTVTSTEGVPTGSVTLLEGNDNLDIALSGGGGHLHHFEPLRQLLRHYGAI